MDVLVFGDSITQGYFDEIQSGWCNCLMLSEMKKILESDHEKGSYVFNLGISGDCTNRLLGRFPAEADVRTKKEYTKNVILLGMVPIIDDIVQPMPWADDRCHYTTDVIEYDKIIQSFCLENDCLFIPMQDLFEERDLHEVLDDGVHPNAEGHRLIFGRVKGVLEKEGII